MLEDWPPGLPGPSLLSGRSPCAPCPAGVHRCASRSGAGLSQFAVTEYRRPAHAPTEPAAYWEGYQRRADRTGILSMRVVHAGDRLSDRACQARLKPQVARTAVNRLTARSASSKAVIRMRSGMKSRIRSSRGTANPSNSGSGTMVCPARAFSKSTDRPAGGPESARD